MKKLHLSVVVVFLLLFSLSPASFGQPAKGRMAGGGWGPEGRYNRMYDLKTVETVSGEVLKVQKIRPMKGMSYGIHLLVKTDKETIDVHLGPAWYIDNQEIMIKSGDKVEIKGSRIEISGKPAIVASEVKMGGEVLKLRDEHGFPLWAGWRKP